MGDFIGEVGGVDGGGGVAEFVADGGFCDVVWGEIVPDTEGGEDGFRERWTGGVWEARIGLRSRSSVEKVKMWRGATHRLVVVVVDLHGCCCIFKLADS